MFNYDALQAAGIETVVVEYNGAGDEGYIEEITPTPDVELGDLYEEIDREAYAVLERLHSGWEINEGSNGHITINVKDRKAFVHHGENRIEQTWYDNEV